MLFLTHLVWHIALVLLKILWSNSNLNKSCHPYYLKKSDLMSMILIHQAKTWLVLQPKLFSCSVIQSPREKISPYIPYVNLKCNQNHINEMCARLGHRLTIWGRVTHIYVSNLNVIGIGNGLSTGQHQAIIRTSVGILPIWSLGTNDNEVLIEIHTFSFTKKLLKTTSAKWRPLCLGLIVFRP